MNNNNNNDTNIIIRIGDNRGKVRKIRRGNGRPRLPPNDWCGHSTAIPCWGFPTHSSWWPQDWPSWLLRPQDRWIQGPSYSVSSSSFSPSPSLLFSFCRFSFSFFFFPVVSLYCFYCLLLFLLMVCSLGIYSNESCIRWSSTTMNLCKLLWDVCYTRIQYWLCWLLY